MLLFLWYNQLMQEQDELRNQDVSKGMSEPERQSDSAQNRDKQRKENSRKEKRKFIAITAAVFIIAEIGRFSSLGWGLFFTPWFAVLFLVSCGCFIALTNKQRIDYIVYVLMCISYILWGYTWLDIVDYGDPRNLLTDITGLSVQVSSWTNFIVTGICILCEIFSIIRTSIGNHPRRDIGVPWDKNRKKIMISVFSVAAATLLVNVVLSLVYGRLDAVLFVINELLFVGGGVFYANIKKKARLDDCLFLGLCLIFALSFMGCLMEIVSGAESVFGIFYSVSIEPMLLLMLLLMSRRRADKRFKKWS